MRFFKATMAIQNTTGLQVSTVDIFLYGLNSLTPLPPLQIYCKTKTEKLRFSNCR